MVSYDEITCECLECRELFHRTPRWATPPRPPCVLERHENSIVISHFTACGHRSERVEIEKTAYANGGIALQMWDDEGPFITVTCWVPGLPADCVAIKNYAENEGCLEQLQQAGVIASPLRYQSGFPVCQLLF